MKTFKIKLLRVAFQFHAVTVQAKDQKTAIEEAFRQCPTADEFHVGDDPGMASIEVDSILDTTVNPEKAKKSRK